MSLPVVQMPPDIRRLLNTYRKNFTKPQFKHFKRIVTGQIVSDKKNIQEINDCFSDCDQSSLNRFLTSSNWDEEGINEIRINQLRKSLNPKSGILVIDPTMLHKTGKHIEKANYHYSGKTKKKEWGHTLVNSFFISEEGSFPLKADMYLRKVDSGGKYPFRTVREIGIAQVEYCLKNKLPLEIVMIDAGLYADFLLKELKSYGLKYIAGVRITNKISIDRKERISINDYLNTLTDLDFGWYFINNEVYFLHVKEIYSRGVGKEKLLISYKLGDEDTIKIYTTNLLNYSGGELMSLLLKRWDVEGLHRDTKQFLGLEDYQLRKFDAIQKVVCVVLVAYTLIVLARKQSILNPLKRVLQTIGEGCRFFRLVAIKGWRWLKRKARNITNLKEIMNRYVFVKNAKV